MTLFASRARSDAVRSLDVHKLDRRSWRVTDSSRTGSPETRIVGFIERLRSDRYEVLWLTPPIGWAYFASFDSALEALEDRETFLGTIEASRDPAVEAARPLFRHRIVRRSTFRNARED